MKSSDGIRASSPRSFPRHRRTFCIREIQELPIAHWFIQTTTISRHALVLRGTCSAAENLSCGAASAFSTTSKTGRLTSNSAASHPSVTSPASLRLGGQVSRQTAAARSRVARSVILGQSLVRRIRITPLHSAFGTLQSHLPTLHILTSVPLIRKTSILDFSGRPPRTPWLKPSMWAVSAENSLARAKSIFHSLALWNISYRHT